MSDLCIFVSLSTLETGDLTDYYPTGHSTTVVRGNYLIFSLGYAFWLARYLNIIPLARVKCKLLAGLYPVARSEGLTPRKDNMRLALYYSDSLLFRLD